jgi:hypothetical protein
MRLNLTKEKKLNLPQNLNFTCILSKSTTKKKEKNQLFTFTLAEIFSFDY